MAACAIIFRRKLSGTKKMYVSNFEGTVIEDALGIQLVMMSIETSELSYEHNLPPPHSLQKVTSILSLQKVTYILYCKQVENLLP